MIQEHIRPARFDPDNVKSSIGFLFSFVPNATSGNAGSAGVVKEEWRKFVTPAVGQTIHWQVVVDHVTSEGRVQILPVARDQSNLTEWERNGAEDPRDCYAVYPAMTESGSRFYDEWESFGEQRFPANGSREQIATLMPNQKVTLTGVISSATMPGSPTRYAYKTGDGRDAVKFLHRSGVRLSRAEIEANHSGLNKR